MVRAIDRPRIPQITATNTASPCFRRSSTLPRVTVKHQLPLQVAISKTHLDIKNLRDPKTGFAYVDIFIVLISVGPTRVQESFNRTRMNGSMFNSNLH